MIRDRVSNHQMILFSQIGILIQELGLSQVLNTNVSELTPSEIRRLKIACYLLSDADIILLDRPTTGMDIFDTFFLVEFLRQWANGGSCEYSSWWNNLYNEYRTALFGKYEFPNNLFSLQPVWLVKSLS